MEITGKTALVTGATVAWDGSWPRSSRPGRSRRASRTDSF